MIDLSPQNSQIAPMPHHGGEIMMPQNGTQRHTQNSPVLCDENSTSPLCNMGGIVVGGGSNAGSSNSVSDVFPQSLKRLLTQNLGRTMLAMFLIGTQHNMLLRGVLTDVGNDYIVLYDKDRDSYITGDYYALKFVEFMPEEGRQNTAP